MGALLNFENESQRIWPLNEENRKAKIEQFAKEYGFCLSFYSRECVQFLKKNATGPGAARMKYWEIIADNLSKAGGSSCCVSAVDSNGRTIWIADAHRGDGKRFVVRADEKLTAFMELESAIQRDVPA